jgi:hypothetical protein
MWHPMRDYNVPSDVECEDGTQDSPGRKTFPKVNYSLPEYLLYENIAGGDDLFVDEEVEPDRTHVDIDSSNREWYPDYMDCLESSDDAFDVDIVGDGNVQEESDFL